MDADPGWDLRSSMDVGEHGFGPPSSERRPGVDCPEHATVLEATIAGDAGEPVTRPGVACVLERPAGGPPRRHAEIVDGSYEGRPEVDLVVRTVPTVGDYDDVIDTILTRRGETAGDAGATGVDAPKGVETAPISDATAEADTATGGLVAPNVLVVSHVHHPRRTRPPVLRARGAVAPARGGVGRLEPPRPGLARGPPRPLPPLRAA